MKLTNKCNRPLGIPGARASIVLGKGESVDITDADLSAIHKNRTASSWLDSGALVVTKKAKAEEKPEAKTVTLNDDDIVDDVPQIDLAVDVAIVKHVGRGRYNVLVNGEQLSDEPLDKAEAEKMADEYNASGN